MTSNGAQNGPKKQKSEWPQDDRLPSTARNTDYLTTNAGTPVISNDHSLTAGPRGPVLMEDIHLLEKLGQFGREKVPERVVHARGMVAKGYFEATHDISSVTMAAPFAKVGKRTPVAARFSTVVHEKGSPESLRDVRGFSVKFYTQDGNWDFVGNNIPVFFIRDGMKFPDLVHALRPNPKTNIQEGWRILDFLSHHPESTHVLTWLLDDNGIPANWRTLEGYGVHTFVMINSEGKQTYVKLHFRPSEGAKFLTDEEAVQVGELNMRHSHATHDLYNAIADGNFPEWSFSIQTMDPAQEMDYDFDPLDATKVWPEDQFPLQPVGKMVLDTNVSNFFTEAEQIAFNPGYTIPGIAPSNDKLLQSRIFSYSDTQRYRIGANYQMLPINAPKCPFHINNNDGDMNFMMKDEEVNYNPSMLRPKEQDAKKATLLKGEISGQRVKENIPKTNDFQQAGERYRTFDAERKKRFQTHAVGWLTDPKCPKEVKKIWLNYWSKVDAELGKDLEKQVDLAADSSPAMAGATKA